MLRGKILFKCDECGRLFRAPDIEYMATVFSVPQPCPGCGSLHTYPAKDWPFGKATYRDIWTKME